MSFDRSGSPTDKLRPRRGPVFVALALATSLVSACGGQEVSGGVFPTTTGAIATTSTAPIMTTTTVATTASTAAPFEPSLALAPDGLLVVTSDTGSTTQFTFGSTQDQVMFALRELLGEPSEEGPGSAECPNGQDWTAVWPETLLVAFSGGSFLTWSLRPDSTLTDMTGVGLGSSLTDLEATWTISAFDSSLGREFFTEPAGEGLGGVLSDGSETAVVESLWAGPACIFR